MAGIFLIMAACFTWALDTLIRYPLLGAGFSPLQIVLVEHLTLVVVTSPLLWRHRHHYRHLSVKAFGALFFIGGIGSALGTLAFTEAFHYLNPTIVILLQKLQPIVAIALASVLLKERIQRYFVLWGCVILLGSFVMIWPDIIFLKTGQLYYSHESAQILKGYGLTLVAVLAWGATTVCGKYLSLHELPADAIMSGRFFSGLIVLALLALGWSDALHAMPVQALGSTIVMALLSGLIGMWLYYLGLKRLPAQMATLTELTFPIFAAAINWIYLDIPLNLYQISGAILLVTGNIGLRLKTERISRQGVPTKDAPSLAG
jgi:drug/metabolite transporter (DMT)-like permease